MSPAEEQSDAFADEDAAQNDDKDIAEHGTGNVISANLDEQE